MSLIERFAAEHALDLPPIAEPGTFATHAPEWLDLSDFGVVIFAGGFRPDYRSWLPWPDAFDELGFPFQRDGVSTIVPGLFFVGVHFLRTRKSSLFLGVGEDATIVARHVGSHLKSRRPNG
jgi:putative flavoprotein involved in K+ transport